MSSTAAGSVVIVGGGAIGGITAARLANSGLAVTVVEDDETRREAMRTRGIRLTGITDLHARPTIIAPAELDGPISTALVAVKCPQTESALDLVADRLTGDGVAVSLQNGFGAYRATDRLGAKRALGALVTISGYVDAPGTIVQSNTGALTLGHVDGKHTAALERVANLLASVCSIETSPDIATALWSKVAIGAVWFATALVNADVVDILTQDRYRETLGDLTAEVAAIALGRGITCQPVDGFDPMAFLNPSDADAPRRSWEGHLAFWRSIPQKRTGVWRDLAIHHQPTEVRCILSPVVASAAAQGTSVPRLQLLIELIRGVERGTVAMGFDNLERLRDPASATQPRTGHPDS